MWAVRLVKRLAKLAGALAVLVLALWVTWLLLPEAEPELAFNLRTDAEVYSGDERLGTDEISLRTDVLTRIGTPVPHDADSEAVAARLFPGHDFHGPGGVSARTIWEAPAGLEFFTRPPDGEMQVRRVVLFKLSDEEWLAVPLEFRHPDHARTKSGAHGATYGWNLKWSFTKQYEEVRTAMVLGVEGDLPGPDEFVIGPIAIR